MTRTSLREYLAAQRIRYRLASRAQRSHLLDEVVAITRYHRKAAIRLLRETPRARAGPAPVGRPRRYGTAVAGAAQALWEAAGQIGAKRLQPFVPGLLERLTACGELRSVLNFGPIGRISDELNPRGVPGGRRERSISGDERGSEGLGKSEVRRVGGRDVVP